MSVGNRDWTGWALDRRNLGGHRRAPSTITPATWPACRPAPVMPTGASGVVGDAGWASSNAESLQCHWPTTDLSTPAHGAVPVLVRGRTCEPWHHARSTRAPFHPQTCGKIERLWQTLKKWLRARPAPGTIAELNELLDQFLAFYNHQRPHRALRGLTPAEAFTATATAPARPTDRPLPAPVFVTRHTVERNLGQLSSRRIASTSTALAGHVCDSTVTASTSPSSVAPPCRESLPTNRSYQSATKHANYRTREPNSTRLSAMPT